MKLYHGSNIAIQTIDFNKCKPYKDFGRGFYLTEIRNQAELMARRTASVYGGDAVVSTFEFDETAASIDLELSIKRFPAPDEEWALFVMNNRNRKSIHPYHDYDIVIGPVADDAIATLFRHFEDGLIDLPTLVNGLKYNKISSQYLFHSPQSLTYLKYDE